MWYVTPYVVESHMPKNSKPKDIALGESQELRGELADEIGSIFLRGYSPSGQKHFEKVIAELYGMRKPARFRRYLLVLLAQVDEVAHNRGTRVRKLKHAVSDATDEVIKLKERKEKS